jgi:hypothetical protein
MVFCIWYHIHFLWFCPWCHYYVKSYLKLPMIYAIDIIITCYHGHTISHILWYLSPYHGTCAAGWRWLGAPGARCSTGSSHAIANMLGTCVQLNSDCLDAVHGLVALAAARFMLETASVWVKEEGEAFEYLYSHQYLKTWILSPSGLRSLGAWRGGGRLRKHIMRAICSGHLWGVEKCTFSRLS